MKKRLAIILAALLIAASMTACGNKKNNEETTSSNKIDINAETSTAGEVESTTDGGSQSGGATDTDEIKDPGEYTYTETNDTIQVLSSTGAATLRTGDYAVVTSVANGTKLERTGISNDASGYWSKVVYEGEECYIASKLVTTILDLNDGFVETSKTLTKNDGSLIIRIAPDDSSAIIGYISAGEQVTVVAENTIIGWYKISFVPYGEDEASYGYVPSNPEYYETEVNTEAAN